MTASRDDSATVPDGAAPDLLVEEGDRAHARALDEIRAHVRLADMIAAFRAVDGAVDPFFYRVHAPRAP